MQPFPARRPNTNPKQIVIGDESVIWYICATYLEANVDSSPALHTRMTPNLDQEFLSASLAQAARDVAKDMETDTVADSTFALSGMQQAIGNT